MNQTSCFSPAHILLPAEQIPLEQWGCVACDQFTSDRSYWERAAEAAAGSPSALNLILPEVYLEESDVPARVDYVHDEPAVRALTKQGGVGFLLPPFEKSDLFKGIVMGGVLPRKTFSMGHAEEKRYYIECRKIIE